MSEALPSDNLGAAAEALFEGLCARAGLICNGSERDRTGWDFVVEFLAPRYATGDVEITVDDARLFLGKAPAERFPKGGALLISLMGGAGFLSISFVLPVMGAQFDKLGPGAALRSVAVLPVILTVVFGAMYVVFRSKGGYRALKIEGEAEAAAIASK